MFQVGKLYEPVITNNAGFYRYRQGDVVKVVDFYHQAPCVDFQFRSEVYNYNSMNIVNVQTLSIGMFSVSLVM